MRRKLLPLYIVFRYQYNDMARPRTDAIRRTFGDRRDLDFLPPTVLDFMNVGAVNKRDALRAVRGRIW